jgi:hypothetical protein
MEADREIPLLQNVLLYVHCREKKKFWSDFTVTINGRELKVIPFKDGLSVDTGLRKGDLVRDVCVCTGCLNVRGCVFQIRDCVDELHLYIKKKKMTLNGQEPVLTGREGCLLM